jgi:hypothetical protein
MTFNSLGKVVSVTPGTPVPLAASYTPCNMVLFQQTPGQTGNVYVGVAGMVKATGVGVIYAFLPASAAGLTDTKTIPASGELADAVDLEALFIDADTAGQGLFVSYQVE